MKDATRKMSPEEARLTDLLAMVLDDLSWPSLVTSERGDVRIVPRRTRPYAPLIDSLRSSAAEFVVVFPLGDGPEVHGPGGDVLPNEWEIVVVSGDKINPVTRIDDTYEDSEILVKMADGLQDAALDLTSEPSPPCPLHGRHPLKAVEIDNEAMWVCPDATDTWRSQIGGYKHASRQVALRRRPRGGGSGARRRMG
jgi:hypothetical protein